MVKQPQPKKPSRVKTWEKKKMKTELKEKLIRITELYNIGVYTESQFIAKRERLLK